MTEPRKLYREPDRAVVAGICAGIATYMNADVTVVRVVVALLFVLTFSVAAIAYLVMWLIIPPKPASGTPSPPVQQD